MGVPQMTNDRAGAPKSGLFRKLTRACATPRRRSQTDNAAPTDIPSRQSMLPYALCMTVGVLVAYTRWVPGNRLLAAGAEVTAILLLILVLFKQVFNIRD